MSLVSVWPYISSGNDVWEFKLFTGTLYFSAVKV
jgi:hypothetical protein